MCTPPRSTAPGAAGRTPKQQGSQPPSRPQQQQQQQQPRAGAKRKGGPPHPPPAKVREPAPRLLAARFQGPRGDDHEVAFELRHATRAKQARAWVHELLQLADASPAPLVVGYDSETAVRWRRREDGSWHTLYMPVSLLQLAYLPASGPLQPTCLLLQLSSLGFSAQAAEVLSHPNIIKVGIGIVPDLLDLERCYDHAAATRAQGLLDLDWLATACNAQRPLPPDAQANEASKRAAGIKTFPRPSQWSLSALLQEVTQHSLVKKKRVQASDWARLPLTQQQVCYASVDALAGLLCYHALRLRWQQQQQQAQAHKPAQARAAAPDSRPPMAPARLLQHLAGGDGMAAGEEQRWQQLLALGCKATGLALQRSMRAAAWKAERGDATGGGWAVRDGFDVSGACSGYADSPW